MYKSLRRIDYLIGCILTGGLFFVLLYISFNEIQDRFFLVFVLGMSLVFISCLRAYFSIPIIKITDNFIFFKNKKYEISEIENIALISKIKAPFFWTPYDSNGILINFKNNITLSFDEENYSNFQKMRQLFANLKERNILFTNESYINSSFDLKPTASLKEYTTLKCNNWKIVSLMLFYTTILIG